MADRRRRTLPQDRCVPCECCKYPLSQLHHLLPFWPYGETDATLRLCANCHELFHVIEKVEFHKNLKGWIPYEHFAVRSFADESLAQRFKYLKGKVELMRSLILALGRSEDELDSEEIVVSDNEHCFVVRTSA